jgi:hypothetical protein
MFMNDRVCDDPQLLFGFSKSIPRSIFVLYTAAYGFRPFHLKMDNLTRRVSQSKGVTCGGFHITSSDRDQGYDMPEKNRGI